MEHPVQQFSEFFYYYFAICFSALADLYEGIGFKRKAAFFLRVAAMRCVAPQNPHPDWSLCYSLLLKATSGYYLDLTRTVALKTEYIGWPDLQVSKIFDCNLNTRLRFKNWIMTCITPDPELLHSLLIMKHSLILL